MRLHGQTAKIEGGFVLFPKKASWLDAYIHELVGFPNAKNDDQLILPYLRSPGAPQKEDREQR